MKANYAVSYEEPDWRWEKSPTEYFLTLEEASRFYENAVKQDGRFRFIRLDEIKANGDWVFLKEIDLGPPKPNFD